MLDIRRVSPSSQAEVTALFALIAELAEYERLSVTTTPEALSQALEASSGTHAALARWEGHPVGYLVWYRTFSTFRAAERLFLEDLYVTPAHRRLGHGRAMLSWLARSALEGNLASMHWQVLDWNTPAIEFYRGLGATITSNWLDCSISGEALSHLAARSPLKVSS
jgi:GNAT superfamily N-acetyltransferase